MNPIHFGSDPGDIHTRINQEIQIRNPDQIVALVEFVLCECCGVCLCVCYGKMVTAVVVKLLESLCVRLSKYLDYWVKKCLKNRFWQRFVKIHQICFKLKLSTRQGKVCCGWHHVFLFF